MLEGISVVYVQAEGQLTLVITGLTELKSKVIDLVEVDYTEDAKI
jgi:hypothetical protein